MPPLAPVTCPARTRSTVSTPPTDYACVCVYMYIYVCACGWVGVRGTACGTHQHVAVVQAQVHRRLKRFHQIWASCVVSVCVSVCVCSGK
jgi:hypothetical protein